jgi:hypothetical protein
MNERDLRQLAAENGLASEVIDQARALLKATHRLRRGEQWWRLKKAIDSYDQYKQAMQQRREQRRQDAPAAAEDATWDQKGPPQ